jgi:acyl transferase domain-containing protein
VNKYALILNNDDNFLCTRVSFKLNLRGPSIVIQTACSSSLVAIHMAKEAIRRGECDVAMAGGVSLDELKGKGYIYTDGHILSDDGHCRALDAFANGTVTAQGLGVVVLKSLTEAKRDHDQIYAVITGSAVNNDGSNKVSYAAPNPLETVRKCYHPSKRRRIQQNGAKMTQMEEDSLINGIIPPSSKWS